METGCWNLEGIIYLTCKASVSVRLDAIIFTIPMVIGWGWFIDIDLSFTIVNSLKKNT